MVVGVILYVCLCEEEDSSSDYEDGCGEKKGEAVESDGVVYYGAV